MAEMLLINPRRRRAKAKTTHRRRRHKNPAAKSVTTVIRRRRNPISLKAVARRRRRNPIRIGIGGVNLITSIKNAAIGAVGAIAVDAAMGYAAPYLPASLQRVPGEVGVGDAVKAAATVLLGQALKRATKGMSVKMAEGALTVQMTEVLRPFVPASVPLGYASPARIVNGNQRVSPNFRRYTQPGATQLLNRYTQPGATQLLSRVPSARMREGMPVR